MLSLAQAASAVEIRTPSADELTALRRAIGAANASQRRLNTLREEAKTLRTSIDPNPAKLRDASQRLEAQRDTNLALHKEALRQAVEIFGLAPPQKKLPNRDKDGPFGGIGMSW